jgi:hypothetical protein
MFQVIALLSIAIAMQTAAIAQEEAKPETVQVHGKSLALSCAEWKREGHQCSGSEMRKRIEPSRQAAAE